MVINQIFEQEPFVTADGSQIRSLLDRTNAPVKNQSLAEAFLAAGGETQRHFHKLSEEFYYITSGQGEMEIEGEISQVNPGDAILIPAGAWHQIKATGAEGVTLLCCCSPPYSHDDTYFA